VRRGASIGLGLVLLGLALGLLCQGRPSASVSEALREPSLPASREAPPPGPSPSPATRPASGDLSLRGVVRDAQGPVAGAVVLATAVDPQETLSELPSGKGGARGLSLPQVRSWYDADLLLFMRHVSAREGDVLVLARTTSAADGSFLLEGLAPGAFTLWADSPRGAAVLQNVPAGRQDVGLVLAPGRRADGLVAGDDEGPLQAVLVTAVHTSLGRFFDAVTDEKGMFRFEPLPPGDYLLVFTKQGWLPELRSLEELQKNQGQTRLKRPLGFSGRVLQGGAPAARARVRLSDAGLQWDTLTDAQGGFSFEGLREGQYVVLAEKETEMALESVSLIGALPKDFTLVLSPSGFIEGGVYDEAGRPVVSAEVDALAPWTSPAGSGSTDERGRYRLGPLASGSYLVMVDADSYVGRSAKQNLEGGVASLDFTLTKSVPVVGVVEDTEGKPIPHLPLQLWRPGERGRVRSIGHHAYPSMPVKSTETDEQGAFVLSTPAPGVYELTTRSPRVLFASKTVAAPARDVRLVVDRGISLEGVLVDEAGKPVAGAQVLSVDAEPPYGTGSQVGTDEEGHFLLTALSEGRYLLYGWLEGDGALREVSARVEVRRSPSTPVQLRFEPGRSWTGRVEDTLGRPLMGVTVTLSQGTAGRGDEALESAREWATPLVSVLSGPDGRFSFHHLTRMAYELELDKPGYTLVSPQAPEKDSDEPSNEPLIVRVNAGEGRFVLESDEEAETDP